MSFATFSLPCGFSLLQIFYIFLIPAIYILNQSMKYFSWADCYLYFFNSFILHHFLFVFFVYLIKKIFSLEMLSSWKLYLFLFLMFGIANHISPSGSDFQNFWQPVTMLLVTIILLSLIFYPIINNPEMIIPIASRYIYAFVPILYLAIFISVFWLILTYVVYLIVALFRW